MVGRGFTRGGKRVQPHAHGRRDSEPRSLPYPGRLLSGNGCSDHRAGLHRAGRCARPWQRDRAPRAGGATSLAIASLFNLANYFAQPKPSRKRQVTPPPPQKSSNTSTKQPTQDNNNNADDWLEDPISDEDWQYEENTQDSEKANVSTQDSRSYEVNSEPKSSKRQGSVYSYTYREPERSEVRKTESVYDADYRVLKPPYKSPNPAQDDDDDWGFDDEQDDLRSPRQ